MALFLSEDSKQTKAVNRQNMAPYSAFLSAEAEYCFLPHEEGVNYHLTPPK